MRIELLLRNPGNATAIPVNYNHHLAGAIYRTLSASSDEYAQWLHDDGHEHNGKRFKLFTFSQILSDDRVIDHDQLILRSSTIRWQISSPDDDFVWHFANGILERGDLRIDSTVFNVFEVKVLPPPQFTQSMRLIALSPITVSTHIDRPGMNSLHYCRLEDGFYEKVVDNLRRKHSLLTGQDASRLNLDIEFDPRYIERRNGRIHKLISYKGTNIFAYQAPLIVNGDVELIRVGYECGFGDSNSKGFGMVADVSGAATRTSMSNIDRRQTYIRNHELQSNDISR